MIIALYPTGFPVAATYGLCTDEGVIGTMFYVMDMVEGRILWDQTLPGTIAGRAPRHPHGGAEDPRRPAQHRLQGHRPRETIGRPGNYMARQIDRWTKQYKASETQHIDTIERLIEWLPQTVPEDDQTTIVHADYRLDNMVMHPTEPRVDRRAGLGAIDARQPARRLHQPLMQWVNGSIARDPGQEGARHSDDGGIRRGILPAAPAARGLPDLNWYFAYNIFRLAGIVQGIVGRARDGTANSPQAAAMAARVPQLGAAAWKFAQLAGA